MSHPNCGRVVKGVSFQRFVAISDRFGEVHLVKVGDGSLVPGFGYTRIDVDQTGGTLDGFGKLIRQVATLQNEQFFLLRFGARAKPDLLNRVFSHRADGGIPIGQQITDHVIRIIITEESDRENGCTSRHDLTGSRQLFNSPNEIVLGNRLDERRAVVVNEVFLVKLGEDGLHDAGREVGMRSIILKKVRKLGF